MASEPLYGLWYPNPDVPRLGSWTSTGGRILLDTRQALDDLRLPGEIRPFPCTITVAEFEQLSFGPTTSPKE